MTGASVSLLGGLAALASRIDNVLVLLAYSWLTWVVGLYLALVSVRVLGICYFRHAEQIGWFRERPRWGAGR